MTEEWDVQRHENAGSTARRHFRLFFLLSWACSCKFSVHESGCVMDMAWGCKAWVKKHHQQQSRTDIVHWLVEWYWLVGCSGCCIPNSELVMGCCKHPHQRFYHMPRCRQSQQNYAEITLVVIIQRSGVGRWNDGNMFAVINAVREVWLCLKSISNLDPLSRSLWHLFLKHTINNMWQYCNSKHI